MNKVIEADFLLGDAGCNFSWSNLFGLIGRPSFNDTRRVLVIDDDADTTRLVKILLESRGDYFVLQENDASKALQTAREFRPAVVLLDIVMPQADGGDVAARIQSDPELAGTPIIFLTALVTKAEAEHGLKIDGHSFLAKPINISELMDAIDQNLRVRAGVS